ncbi:hypothetical protein ACF059_04790 [Streptomyces sp. NPDC016562]|uniref:hypothetical protein n=1 Tax=Streptomyces sp. NPDC016562 TaxID=3364966 RepID=UPI0036F60DFA
MSESVPPRPSEQSGPSEQPGQPEKAPGGGARQRAALGRLVPRSRAARWAAAGAAVVVVGGGVAALAVADHHDHHRADRGPRFHWTVPGPGPGPGGDGRHAPQPHHEGKRGDLDVPALPKLPEGLGRPDGGAGRQGPGAAAPAPLPSLAIGEAADKAAAAVPGGKVESLRPVAQDGGGSAWLAVVLGQDGVRHAVTVSADGTVTGNTPVDRSR